MKLSVGEEDTSSPLVITIHCEMAVAELTRLLLWEGRHLPRAGATLFRKNLSVCLLSSQHTLSCFLVMYQQPLKST